MSKDTAIKIRFYFMSLWLLFVLIFLLTVDIPICFSKDAHFIGLGPLSKRNWLAFISLQNSIANKTPISARSNREIGGYAPSVYLGKLENKGSVLPFDLDGYVETHWIDHNLLRKAELYFMATRTLRIVKQVCRKM